MRIPLCCVLTLGCGYQSFYPTPTSRSRGDLTLPENADYYGDSGIDDGGTDTLCTDPAGMQAGEQVEVTVQAIAPVQLVEVYQDCTRGGTIPLHTTGATWTAVWYAGVVFRVESPEGAFLEYLQIPFGTGGSWYTEVP